MAYRTDYSKNYNNKNQKRGPSARVRRILTVCLLAVLVLAVVALIVHGVKSHKEKSDSSTEESTVTYYQNDEETDDEDADEDDPDTEEVEVKDYFTELSADYADTHDYCIAVNTKQNIVTVYTQAEDGTFTKPDRAFTCSCGKYPDNTTKLGTFYTEDTWRWEALYGGVYGQYAIRITGPYLFHSVPYYTEDPSDLEVEEYDKLGDNASLGCVRMRVVDVKWLYDHITTGTCVTIYEDEDITEPLTPEAAEKIGDIDESDARYGWDPTDPDENNPWNA